MTLVVLFVLALVVLSYREIVMVYIRPGGSYVVARQNFGPRVAQVCAVALLIDYVVTVAVQTAAGTAAIASSGIVICRPVPAGNHHRRDSPHVLREPARPEGSRPGVRGADVSVHRLGICRIIVGLVREVTGHLPIYDVHALHGTVQIASGTNDLVIGATIFTLLRAFANGGASLTGIEAVSDAVGAFRPPEGRNARQVLVTEGLILGMLVAGISWMAHATHATPRSSGYPTVLAQEAQPVFGHTVIGQALFYVVQVATALILYTGANTSFNGFPFLASYVAGDAFLPRWLLKRGHRLVFSNAIILLTIISVALLIIRRPTSTPRAAVRDRRLHRLHHGRLRHGQVPPHPKEPGWHPDVIINFSAGVLTAIVVAIFAIVKFTEGAWIVVVLFAILVPALIRLNREYQMESEVLEANHRGAAATAAELRPPYGAGLRRQFRPGHPGRACATRGACGPRRCARCTSSSTTCGPKSCARNGRAPTAAWFSISSTSRTGGWPGRPRNWSAASRGPAATHVTVILPRRSYSALLGRLLHDRTADKIAEVVSRIPRSAATIVPYDVQSRVRVLQERQAARVAQALDPARPPRRTVQNPGRATRDRPPARTAGPPGPRPSGDAPAGARGSRARGAGRGRGFPRAGDEGCAQASRPREGTGRQGRPGHGREGTPTSGRSRPPGSSRSAR